jgi:hypothetical protein
MHRSGTTQERCELTSMLLNGCLRCCRRCHGRWLIYWLRVIIESELCSFAVRRHFEQHEGWGLTSVRLERSLRCCRWLNDTRRRGLFVQAFDLLLQREFPSWGTLCWGREERGVTNVKFDRVRAEEFEGWLDDWRRHFGIFAGFDAQL